jgi:hypothetical protein
MAAGKWRILAKAHERRNLAEYEGHTDHDERLLAELIAIANELREAVGSSRAPSAFCTALTGSACEDPHRFLICAHDGLVAGLSCGLV